MDALSATGAALVLEDGKIAWPEGKADAYAIRSPLRWRGRTIGELVADRATPFSDDDEEMLASIAQHAAVALEHGRAVLRGVLAQEIHHRVKNNLQVISSLLNMQQRSLADPAARSAMSDTRQRITALALIYRALYQSTDLRRVDVKQFLEELIAQLISADAGRGGPLVRSELEADPLVIDPDKLAPLALWAVEAITSAQKRSFEGRGGSLQVRFKVGREESRLEVEDDGPGGGEELAGVSRTLMTAFARQLRGRAEIVDQPDHGTVAALIFPTPEAAEPMETEEGQEIGRAHV